MCGEGAGGLSPSSREYKHTETRQKRIRQADTRPAPLNMTGWQKDGERESRTEVKGSKQRLKGGGRGVRCRCSSTYTNLQVPVHYVMLVNVMNTF